MPVQPFVPGQCANCDNPLSEAATARGLYCSAICREWGKHVRYTRRVMGINNGNARDQGVRNAVQIRFAHLMSGGYEGRRTPLPPNVRVDSEKPKVNFVSLDPEHFHLRDEWLSRIMAPEPLRACDDPDDWERNWRKYQLAGIQAVRER